MATIMNSQPNWSPFHCDSIPKDAKPEEYREVAQNAWQLSSALADALDGLSFVMSGEQDSGRAISLHTTMACLATELVRVNTITYDLNETLIERLAREKPGLARVTEAA